MSTVPAGSIIVQAFNPPGNPLARDITDGVREAFEVNGALLSRCPSTALIEGLPPPNIPSQTLSLNDGRVAMITNNVVNLYSAVGTRVRGRSFTTQPPIEAFADAKVFLSGSNRADTFYVTMVSHDPAEAPFTVNLQHGEMHPVTTVMTNTIVVDSVLSDGSGQAPALYGVCTDKDGVLYYIKGDNSDPLLATHTLYAFDTHLSPAVRAVAAYAPGQPYPLPCYMTLNFAFTDGTLAVVFGALYGNVPRQCKRLHPTTGAAIATYLAPSDYVMVWSGLTDADFWIWEHMETLIYVNRASGGINATITPESYGGTAVGIYTLLTPYPVCVQPPLTAVKRAIRRVRRFRLPFQQNMFLYLNRFELLIQPGAAATTGQGSDPLIFVRFSGDGGTTWGPTIRMPAGPLGDYGYRPVINQIGKFRDPMCEVWVSDPIYWYMIGCFIDGEFAPG